MNWGIRPLTGNCVLLFGWHIHDSDDSDAYDPAPFSTVLARRKLAVKIC